MTPIYCCLLLLSLFNLLSCLHSVVTAKVMVTVGTAMHDILAAIHTERDKTTAQPTPTVNSQTK